MGRCVRSACPSPVHCRRAIQVQRQYLRLVREVHPALLWIRLLVWKALLPQLMLPTQGLSTLSI
jgi:hypothetical protein